MAGDTTTASATRSVAELVRVVAGGARPRFLFFWGHQPSRSGVLDAACLSQWWPARFEAEGAAFGSAEQYMMWRKARLFGDERREAEILAARAPSQAKTLGRQVSGFDEAVWEAERWGIVVDASVARFSADQALREYLVGTRRRVLVEASPVDRIWGIGLAADAEQAASPAQWRGLNLLGFALMAARERLA